MLKTQPWYATAGRMPRESRGIRANGIVRVSTRAFLEFYRGARRPRFSRFLYGAPRRLRKFRNLSTTTTTPGGGEIRASFPSYFIFRRACFTHSERVRDSRFNYATRFRHRRVQQSSARLDSFASFFMSRVKLSPRIFARHERRYDLVKERVLHSSSRRQKRMPKGRSLDGLPLRGWRMDSNSQG